MAPRPSLATHWRRFIVSHYSERPYSAQVVPPGDLAQSLTAHKLYCVDHPIVPHLESMGAQTKRTTGQRIRDAYLRAGYNRSQFARALDVHYTTVIAWENSTQAPKDENIRLVADLLGVPEAEIRGYQDPLKAYPAYAEWLRGPEAAHATPEQRQALAMQQWPEGYEPSVLVYHYMYQALNALQSPEQAAEAARHTDEVRKEAEKAGGKPPKGRGGKKAPK
jgi:transcriptional regulator with XRE-family HTH domain